MTNLSELETYLRRFKGDMKWTECVDYAAFIAHSPEVAKAFL